MLEIKKRKKTWHVGGRNTAGCDIPRHTTGCTSKEEAERYKRNIDTLTVWPGRKAYRASLAAPKLKDGQNPTTIAEALKEWLDSPVMWNRAESTREAYEFNVRTKLIDKVDVTAVSQLTVAHMQAIQDGWRGLEDTTIGTYRSTLHSFMAFCVKRKYLPTNPWKEVETVEGSRVKFADKIRGKVKQANATMPLDLGAEPTNWLLIQESIIPFLNNQLVHLGQKPRAATAGKRLAPEAFLAYLQLMYHTGLRRSDALFFRPGDIRDTSSGNGVYTQPHQIKTGDPVTVFLPPWLVAKLRALPRLDPEGLFCFYDGSVKWETYLDVRICRQLRACGKLIGIEGALRPHRFRDSFAVNALNRGMSVEWLARALGHKRMRTTELYYMPFVQSRQEIHEKAWMTLMLSAK